MKTLAVLITLNVLAAPLLALTDAIDTPEGVIVHVNTDAVIDEESRVETVVVVNGDLTLTGTAATVVVVSGTADITDATVESLVVVSGRATLGSGAVVTGDVWLASSDLSLVDDGSVEGSIQRDLLFGVTGAWVVGLFLLLGFAVMVILVGLLAAGIAPGPLVRASNLLTDAVGPTILSALILWIVVPIVAGVIAATVVGIPTAITILVIGLPLMGLLGYVATGVRVGHAVMSRPDPSGRPLLATFVGLVLLILIGLIPVLGWLVGFLAAFFGGGAIALAMWRSFRGEGEAPQAA